MILFYIDPLSGQIYTQKDIDMYLKKMNEEVLSIQPPVKSTFSYLHQWLSEIAIYEKKNGDNDKHILILKSLDLIIEN